MKHYIFRILITLGILYQLGCYPVSVGVHTVDPDINKNIDVSLSTIRVSCLHDAQLAQRVVTALHKSDAISEFYYGDDCETRLSPIVPTDKSVFLEQLLEYKRDNKLQNLDVDYIVAIQHSQLDQWDEDLVTTIINFSDPSQRATTHIHTEGDIGALNLPVPYVAFFVFYSEPDVQKGSTEALGELLSEIIAQNTHDSTPRILLLESYNLIEMVGSTAFKIKKGELNREDKDQPQVARGPISFYKAMIEGPRESSDPLEASMAYNPIYHAIVLPTAILLGPMLWAFDKATPDDANEVAIRTEQEAVTTAQSAAKNRQWELAYQALELILNSYHSELREKSQILLKEYPEILDGGLATFSKEALTKSVEQHGDYARAIELRRLKTFKRVASPDKYSIAEQNVLNIIPVSEDICLSDPQHETCIVNGFSYEFCRTKYCD